jgi:hypothetical protein
VAYRICAIDPGKRSGCVVVDFETQPVLLMVARDVPGGLDGAIAWLDKYQLEILLCEAIVIENFKKREGVRGVKDDASRVIGAVTQWAHQYGIPVVLRAPDGRLKQVPDWVLDRLYGPGVFSGNKNRNIKEAVRHATAYGKSQLIPSVLEAWK